MLLEDVQRRTTQKSPETDFKSDDVSSLMDHPNSKSEIPCDPAKILKDNIGSVERKLAKSGSSSTSHNNKTEFQ